MNSTSATQTIPTPRSIAEALRRTITRDPAGRKGTVSDTTLSEGDAPMLLTNTADPTDPERTRSFVITVREVDPDAEVINAQVHALAVSLIRAAKHHGEELDVTLADMMAQRLILTGAVLA